MKYRVNKSQTSGRRRNLIIMRNFCAKVRVHSAVSTKRGYCSFFKLRS